MFLMRFPNGLSKVFTASYDDGRVEDLRLAEIFRKNGIKATFNINSGKIAETEGGKFLTAEQMKKAYSGFEVAVHTVHHPHLEELPREIAADEVLSDRKALEDIFGTPIRGMAYPYGTYNADTVEVLKSTGIAYSRTVKSTLNYFLPENWLTLNPTCHHRNPELNAKAKRFLEIERKQNETCLMFYLWGHSYEFTDNDNWCVIEDLAKLIGGKDDIWYATNIEIFDYVKAYQSLNVSVSGKIIHNPTATDVFICADGKTVKIGAGKTVEI